MQNGEIGRLGFALVWGARAWMRGVDRGDMEEYIHMDFCSLERGLSISMDLIRVWPGFGWL